MSQSLKQSPVTFIDLLLYLHVCCALSFCFFLPRLLWIHLCFSFLACLYLSVCLCLIVHSLISLPRAPAQVSAHFSFQNWHFFKLSAGVVWITLCPKDSGSPQEARLILSRQVKLAGGSMKARSDCNSLPVG